MKRALKNIIRLPSIYLPLFFSSVLIVLLILLCAALRAECVDAMRLLEDRYDVTLTLALKERNEKIVADDGSITTVNRNERLLDLSVLNLLADDERISEIQYPTNCFYISLSMVCSEEQYAEINACIEKGKPFSMPSQAYWAGDRMVYDMGVVACTDEQWIAEAMRMSAEDLKVTYIEGQTLDEGILLPRNLYEFFGSPTSLVFGWYTENFQGLNLGTPQTGIMIQDWLAQRIELNRQMPEPPQTQLRVVGYYECGEKETVTIITTPDRWNEIYRVYDYYLSTDNQGWHVVREDANAWNELGVREIGCRLEEASKTEEVISDLLASGLDARDFAITAEDYEYKFAMSQLESVKKIVDILYVFSIAFGVLIMLLLLRHVVRKRGGELYTLRTLGQSHARICLGILFEITPVLLVAVAVGVLAGKIFGNAIFNTVNWYLEQRVHEAVNNLSQITEFMKDSEQIKAQLIRAIEAYEKNQISLRYRTLSGLCVAFVISVPCAATIAELLTVKTLSGSLMKRGKEM